MNQKPTVKEIQEEILIICVLTFLVYGLFENYFFKTQFNFTLLFIFANYYGNSNKLHVKKRESSKS